MKLCVKNSAVCSVCENVHHKWGRRKDFLLKNVLIYFENDYQRAGSDEHLAPEGAEISA